MSIIAFLADTGDDVPAVSSRARVARNPCCYQEDPNSIHGLTPRDLLPVGDLVTGSMGSKVG